MSVTQIMVVAHLYVPIFLAVTRVLASKNYCIIIYNFMHIYI